MDQIECSMWRCKGLCGAIHVPRKRTYVHLDKPLMPVIREHKRFPPGRFAMIKTTYVTKFHTAIDFYFAGTKTEDGERAIPDDTVYMLQFPSVNRATCLDKIGGFGLDYIGDSFLNSMSCQEMFNAIFPTAAEYYDTNPMKITKACFYNSFGFVWDDIDMTKLERIYWYWHRISNLQEDVINYLVAEVPLFDTFADWYDSRERNLICRCGNEITWDS